MLSPHAPTPATDRGWRWRTRKRQRKRDEFAAKIWKRGAPGEIRTPDPQIRSLVLYPAELRARRVVAIGFDAGWQDLSLASLPVCCVGRSPKINPAPAPRDGRRARRRGREWSGAALRRWCPRP